MKICILYSGGLDSLIMRQMAKVEYPEAEVKLIYYQHGADSEIEEINLLPPEVEIRNVDWLTDSHRPVAKKDDPMGGAIYIPGRNMVFATLAACQELPDEIWMGTLYDECNPSATDKNNVFRTGLNETLNYVLSPFIDKVTVRFPFVEKQMTKVDTVRWALANGLSKEDVTASVSCWHYNEAEQKACGRCKQCFKRFFVMLINGIRETNLMVNPLLNGQHYVEYYMTKENPNLDEHNVLWMILGAYGDHLLRPDESWIVEQYA